MKKKKQIHKFVKKVASDSKPIKQKKIPVSKIDMPKKWNVSNPQATGFICSEFEVILDADEK